MSLQLRIQTFTVAKRGNAPEENEDCCGANEPPDILAIADGATESSFAARWAQLLVQQFVAGRPFAQEPRSAQDPVDWLRAWLAGVQQEWHRGIDWPSLPWYAQVKGASGAGAAFLGVVFDLRPTAMVDGCTYQLVAVGDACLFQVRRDRLDVSTPLSSSESFGSRPTLLSSMADANEVVWDPRRGSLRYEVHDAIKGDVLFLATDALAQWFLAQHERQEQPWEELLRLETQEQFAAFVDGLRGTAAIRNDDVTLLRCLVDGNGR